MAEGLLGPGKADMESFKQRDPWFQGPRVCSRMRNTGSRWTHPLGPCREGHRWKRAREALCKCRAQSNSGGRADV